MIDYMEFSPDDVEDVQRELADLGYASLGVNARSLIGHAVDLTHLLSHFEIHVRRDQCVRLLPVTLDANVDELVAELRKWMSVQWIKEEDRHESIGSAGPYPTG